MEDMIMDAVAQWEILELTWPVAGTFANPFLDVDLRVDFIQGPRLCSVDGFYDGMQDGSHVWRVRFAPPKQGEWQYRTFAGIPALNGKTGSFLCTEPVSRGGLTVSPHYANWFCREDGLPQLVSNEGWYPHPGNGRFFAHEDVDYQQPSEADMAFYFQTLADHGVNLVIDIAQLFARQSTVTDTSFRWPWQVVDAANNRFDKDRFNLDYYRRMDRFLAFAREKEIFFAMELLYDNSVVRPREWSHHPVNRQNGGWLDGNANGTGWDVMFNLENSEHVLYTSRYLRYTIARFAAYWNVVWSVGSENGNLIRLPQELLPFALFPAEKAAAWYNYWGDFIARHDPYGRLHSLGDAGKQPLMVTSAHNNFIITQDPRNYPKNDADAYYRTMNAFGEEFWYYGRPVVIGEMTAGTGGHYDMERRLYWIGLASGYHMGRADRHFGLVADGQLVESEKFKIDGIPPIYADLRRMKDFITSRQIRFWRMRPSDDLLDVQEGLVFCLAAREEEYLLYFVHGGKVSLTIPEVDFEWYNPRTGETAGKGFTIAGLKSFTAPDGEDWVLYLVARKGG